MATKKSASAVEGEVKAATAAKAQPAEKKAPAAKAAPKAAAAKAAPKAAAEKTTAKTAEKAAAPKAAAPKAAKATKTAEPKKATATQQKLQLVRFTKFSPQSLSVHIAGTFNDWNPTKHSMERAEDGTWTVELKLPAGQHQYKFIFDGKTWEHDPSVDHVPDNQGGCNNLITI